MERYNKITNKNNREIVLLKGLPCVWGKCTFCDYIDDNGLDEKEINKLNKEILGNVDGEFGVLEVINSGSCFELPRKTLEYIKEVVDKNNIKKIFLESHWCYKNRLDEMRKFFNVEIVFKIGVETFDNNFRNLVLNKNANFKTVEEVKELFQSVCIMVGIKGQTKEIIRKDIQIVLDNFKYATINVFIENTTDVKRDEDLIKWFCEEFKELENHETIEVLFHNTDFGVGD